MSRRNPKPARVDCAEVRRARYLDVRAIRESEFAVTPAILRAPFPQSSAELRAAADRALEAETETAAAVKGLKKP